MNKLYRSAIFLILIITIFAVSGCSGKSAAGDPETTGLKNEKMNLTLLGSSPNGPGLIIMNGLAECINKSYPDSIVTNIPGNLATNIIRINNNEADACMTNTFMALAATSGEDPYEKKMDNLAAVTYLMPEVYQIVINDDLGIDSFNDFIDNKMKIRISAGMTGSATAQFVQQLLSAYGLSIQDTIDWGCEIVYQNIDNSAQMLTDNRIDMMVVGIFLPTPTIQELAQNKDIALLTIDPEVINKLCSQQKYYNYVIPAGTYTFLKEDLKTVNNNAIIAVPKNSSEENVYKMTKAFHENLDYLKTIHASMAGITAEQMINNLGIDLHPGAEKYYREAGIIPQKQN
ncbi:MAG TPA: TAXI family TRAP transporter solute-binding subunit [Syntrophomonadaceae bacterium]|nr:TAXI family TRAP transporter solute-binding subunit [Syntrophomonadaceae bacterium]HRX21890.1 TAXI family TRAP transporter solute-binding subunit [Syntrophomonadaceae bacterium]